MPQPTYSSRKPAGKASIRARGTPSHSRHRIPDGKGGRDVRQGQRRQYSSFSPAGRQPRACSTGHSRHHRRFKFSGRGGMVATEQRQQHSSNKLAGRDGRVRKETQLRQRSSRSRGGSGGSDSRAGHFQQSKVRRLAGRQPKSVRRAQSPQARCSNVGGKGGRHRISLSIMRSSCPRWPTATQAVIAAAADTMCYTRAPKRLFSLFLPAQLSFRMCSCLQHFLACISRAGRINTHAHAGPNCHCGLDTLRRQSFRCGCCCGLLAVVFHR